MAIISNFVEQLRITLKQTFKLNIMRTLHYKTLTGLLRQTQQMTVEQLFTGRFNHKTKGWCNFTLDEGEKRIAAKMFAKYIYQNPHRVEQITEALMAGRGELDLFQCFYIDYSPKYGIYCSNSLSGDAFDYCRRMYVKRYCY